MQHDTDSRDFVDYDQRWCALLYSDTDATIESALLPGRRWGCPSFRQRSRFEFQTADVFTTCGSTMSHRFPNQYLTSIHMINIMYFSDVRYRRCVCICCSRHCFACLVCLRTLTWRSAFPNLFDYQMCSGVPLSPASDLRSEFAVEQSCMTVYYSFPTYEDCLGRISIPHFYLYNIEALV